MENTGKDKKFMITLTKNKPTFPRGIHPPERKEIAADSPIEVLNTPREVRIPMLQHLGAPCTPIHKPRTEVTLGDKVGDADAFITAPVHASIKGVIGRGSVATLPNGRHVAVVPIKAADEQPLEGRALFEDIYGGEWETEGLEKFTPEEIANKAREAGLVGLGGAAFPTHVKLRPKKESPIETLLINGCECEPYLTADYRLMVEAPKPIISGALLAKYATGAHEVAVCIEDNKPKAIETMRKAAEGTEVRIQVVRTKYPQGGEKQLIKAVSGREVPVGGLPPDIGFVVLNVATAASLARAVLRGKPLTHRIVSVSGSGITEPKNLLVPIGASYKELIRACGGVKPEAVRVIAGGPMMGFTLASPNVPVTKGTSGITILTENEVRKAEETSCVRCGRCVDVCPMNLVPTKLAIASRMENIDVIARYSITACMECGCCAYVCPASIPLVQLIRHGKVLYQEAQKSEKK